MGGFGSGRWIRLDRRETTAERRSIDIREFKRSGWLSPGTTLSFSDGRALRVVVEDTIVASIRSTGGEQHRGYLSIRYRECHLGGKRPMFSCPGCDQPVFLLYYRSGSYRCRRCLRLGYESQSEDALSRSMRKTTKLLRKLAPDACLMTGVPPKPAGMHNTTYRFIAARAERCLSRLMPEWIVTLERSRERLATLNRDSETESDSLFAA